MMEYWNIGKSIFFPHHSIIPLFHSSISFLLCGKGFEILAFLRFLKIFGEGRERPWK